MKSIVLAVIGCLLVPTCSIAQEYRVTGAERTILIVDSTYDEGINDSVWAYIAPYKHIVDSVMSPVVGHIANSLSARRPESPLSNLLADILVWASAKYGEQVVMGVYNMGGIRASLPKGTLTYGDVLEVAPFENKICFLTLSGVHLMELFRNMAAVYGEGVSHGVEIVITKEGELKSARLNGEEIDADKDYRIATIDYLAEGNDRMTAFKHKTDFIAPDDERNDTRYIICDYFKEMEARGVAVEAYVEGRTIVEDFDNIGQ